MRDSILGDIAEDIKKLSQNENTHYLDIPGTTPKAKKNKKVRRVTEPHIFTRTRKGQVYYFHTDGVKQTYLGTADAILRKVKG